MEVIASAYITRGAIWLFISTLFYFLMNGAQIFETAVLVPKWASSPPESFQILKGLNLKSFWIIVHSIHEITFVLAIIFCWKLDLIRNWLLILFVIHFAVRVWTLAYFAPNIIEFEKIANGANIRGDFLNRASLWQTLNYIRVAIFVVISLGLIPLCIKILTLRFK